MKDVDLAGIYKITIKEIKTKIRNNRSRFPYDFMIEFNEGGYAFTEPGILILGGLLKSERAIKVHLQFIDYFVHHLQENGTSAFDLLNNFSNKL